MDKSRQQFEDKFHNKFKFELNNKGNYRYFSTSIAWDAWQVSRERLQVELPERPYYEPFTYEAGVDDGIEMCKQILISNGVKIKNE
ncbi:hypothetical protein QDQ39_07575 [Providencia rettgeri]|uniref:hypothetical protein n=1 Tax=Providencia rettgeri TaxID=587 RepID=UPI002448506E|nr:hypothetical protein [Providencia rettgeri]MDH2395664.1 hypothetical protein [Providencia rettgeri]